jgi:hypothetical protein
VTDDEVARRYLAGKSLAQVALDASHSPSWVRASLARSGVPLRPRGRPRSTSRQLAAEMLHRGVLGTLIESETGMPVADAQRALAYRRSRGELL